MFKHYFNGINGIEIYPIFLLIVFITFFVTMTIWLIRSSKSKMDEISKIPLSHDTDQSIHS
jgi:cytochrome c oxidase cbb3-type subunit 4